MHGHTGCCIRQDSLYPLCVGHRSLYLFTKPQHPTPGGGNDVISLRDDCVKFNDNCRRQIDDAMGIAGQLLDKMQREGVQHVMYLGFYKVDLLGEAVNYGADKAKATCEGASIHCIYVETRDMDVKTGFDHIHPTWNSYRDLGDRIWEVKNANNIPF